MKEMLVNKTKLSLTEGDITTWQVDAMVNAANRQLQGGGGVDGAIHRAGGPEIMRQCRKIGGCPTGQAVITTAGNLRAKKVIHTVGPVYQGRAEDARLLAACYLSSLELAARHGLRTVAFPSISTGAYGYPLDEAAQVALRAILQGIADHPGAFDEISLVLFSGQALAAYERALAALN